MRRSVPESSTTAFELSDFVIVDEDDGFFFDHPLDHVPAMLLIDTCMGMTVLAVEQTSPHSAFRVRHAEFRFFRFCEKSSPAVARVVAPGADPYDRHIEIEQDGSLVGEARIVVTPGDEISLAPQAVDGCAKADRTLVHKRSGEHVLVGPMHETEAGQHVCPTVEPGRRVGKPIHQLSRLIEAVRQCSTMFEHTVLGTAMDARLVVSSVELNLPNDVSGPCRPVLGCRLVSNGTPNSTIETDVLVDGVVVGQVRFSGRSMSDRAYRRLRPDVAAVTDR